MTEMIELAYIYMYKHTWASLIFQLVQNPPCNARDLGLIHELGRSPGGGQGNPLQYSCLENSKDREAWEATVHRVTKNQTQLKGSSTRTD